ncbi:hypothetical protein LIER_08367 [Lithospermum erythrorhizon]|uniref:Uncharacterized protein n=1 Tax=Lithospermum erythrorhizon TaxID=34254 RepID=A0AAV3PBV6_LITER
MHETPIMEEIGENSKKNRERPMPKKSFANLFRGNRHPYKGFSFDYTKPIDGMVELEEDDVEPIEEK